MAAAGEEVPKATATEDKAATVADTADAFFLPGEVVLAYAPGKRGRSAWPALVCGIDSMPSNLRGSVPAASYLVKYI